MPSLKPHHAAALAGALLLVLTLPLVLDFGPAIAGLDVKGTLEARGLPPPPTLRIVSPEPGQGAATSVRVQGEAASERGVVVDVQWRLDGGAWSSVPDVVGGAPLVTFDATLEVARGDHVVEVRAYDGESFSLVERASVRADPRGAPPTLRISAPQDGQGLPAGPTRVGGTTTAPTQVSVTLAGVRRTTDTREITPGVHAWALDVTLPPGRHTLLATTPTGLPRSIDLAAHDATPPPTLRLLAPAPGSAFGSGGDPACPSACILFAGVAPGAVDVLLSLDGGPETSLAAGAPRTYNREAGGAWTYALPTAALLSGEHSAALTPVGPDGVLGATREVGFTVRTSVGVRIAGDEAPHPTHTPLRFNVQGERVMETTWLLDGHPVGNGTSVELTLPTPGLHTLTALTSDAQGRAGTARLTLFALNQAPVASFAPPAAPVTGPAVLTATGRDADGGIVQWRWDFGDGRRENTTGPRVAHEYARAGVYRVNLTPVDDQGASGAPATGLVTVLNGAPVADFTWHPVEPQLLESVTFTDLSADPERTLGTRRWDFGDGTTAEGTTVTHRYATRGPHAVTLTVTDADGAGASATRTVNVANVPARAAFRHEPAVVTTGAEVLFSDASVKTDGRLVAWAWDFGHPAPPCDGACNPLHLPRVNGSRVLHAFPAPGDYTVNLTVTDDLGALVTARSVVTVHDAAPVVSDIVLTPAQPVAASPVAFAARVRDMENGHLAHAWDFGDGNRSEDAAPNHTYARSGFYQATLTVTDAAGANVTLSFPVTVLNAKPNATLRAPLGAYAGRIAVLEADAADPDGRIVRYRFDADDDGVTDCDGLAPACAFTYPASGAYVAHVAVVDDEGGSVLAQLALNVTEAPDETPPPQVTIETPTPEETLAGRMLLSGVAHGPRPVERVEAQLRNASWSVSVGREAWMRADGTDPWRLFLDTRAIGDGEYTLVIRAVDADGRVGNATLPVLVANGPRPSLVGLDIHNAPSEPLRADHELRGSAWHPDGPVTLRYRLDEGPWSDLRGDPVGFTFTLDVEALGPGEHALRIDARRGVREHTEHVVRFRVADPPPTLLVDEPPHPLAYGLLTAKGRVVGEAKVHWRLDNDVWRELPQGPEWRLAVETQRMEGGPRTLWLKAVSPDGLAESEPAKYRVRIINPSAQTEEDRRLVEQAREPAPEPGAVDLEQVARERQMPAGAWLLVAALGLAALATRRR